jgi:hypothetical protein
MTDQEKRFLQFYEEYRRGAQSKWYRNRYETYERAHRQSVTLTSFVLFLSSAASILSVRWQQPKLGYGMHLSWPVLAAVLAATGTAIAAYRSLYGFQENSRLYRDADNSLAAVLADSPVECENCPEATIHNAADYIPKVEEVFRREQGQWGQLVAQIRSVTVPQGQADEDDGAPGAAGAGGNPPAGGGGGGGANAPGGGADGGGANPPAGEGGAAERANPPAEGGEGGAAAPPADPVADVPPDGNPAPPAEGAGAGGQQPAAETPIVPGGAADPGLMGDEPGPPVDENGAAG